MLETLLVILVAVLVYSVGRSHGSNLNIYLPDFKESVILAVVIVIFLMVMGYSMAKATGSDSYDISKIDLSTLSN